MSNRPLSPHLSIYKPQITSVLSIMHRASGFFLYLGLLILSWHIISEAFSNLLISELYLSISVRFFSSFIGKMALIIWMMAFYYHFCNGIRHLIWDMGRGFSIDSVKISGVIVIISSLGLSIFSWFYALHNLIN